ncbi:STAS domain-containing protein [Clostridiaceae bacterium UIB06]|uniref:STAS domain-containing protein n=1 Tax=Clostridium thailandense TaxID=2794346 RepID=A0A949X3I2_9CLOT|nr:STAS domain-containing protein [Clostridium thailandense]MBV7272448.1 STAS domain-containing protein [Clostridium thailandense]MCH5136972.1 STAS domain-containing protein [Clostridiaceae bacterium UIB06]
MEIKQIKNEDVVTLALSGRLDTITSSKLGEELEKVFQEGKINLVFDFEALDYISSAGLRVLLIAQKKINALAATMKIINANETVKEVFEVTGFSGILNIE